LRFFTALPVDLLRRYSNRSDLLEQLHKVAAILADDSQDDGVGAVITESAARSRRLRDRFSPDELRSMIDLYWSRTTAREVATRFGVSLRSVKRLSQAHGVRRRL
jgi:DNA-directed RNA polymerase specialized sigma24 family protein